MQKKWIGLFIGLVIVSAISMAATPMFQIEDSTGKIVGWWNSSGTINTSEEVIARGFLNLTGHKDWITPEYVLDIDDADIEGDVNTYFDIAGDTAEGNIDMNNYNITNIGEIKIGSYCIMNTTATNLLITNVGC
jgi:hypothetical protein